MLLMKVYPLHICVCIGSERKILLKGKKIGGLEDSMNGMVDEPLTGEVSDEEETAEIDDDHHRTDSIRHRGKVQ